MDVQRNTHADLAFLSLRHPSNREVNDKSLTRIKPMSIEVFSSDKRLIQDFLLAASQRPIIIIVYLPTRTNSNRQFFGPGFDFTRQFCVFFSPSLDSFSHGMEVVCEQ